MNRLTCLLVPSLAAVGAGCATQRPVTMAPPVAPAQVAVAPPMGQAAPVQSGVNDVWDWHDVPRGQEVPINRGLFDQGGYQLLAASGETIAIPFANQNMYVLKFGQSRTGGMYFVNDGEAPVLYVPTGAYLENAAAQGARWYPFSQGYHYDRPVYIGLAPSWNDFVGMGWYPGMAYYGGYWGYRPWTPGFLYSPMVGLNINIGGHPYYGWSSYRTYYHANPSRVSWGSASSFRYNSVGRRASSSSFGRTATGSSGSFGSFGRSRPGNSFGTSSGSRPSSSFGSSASRPSGSFGSGSGSSFGSGGGSFGRTAGRSGSFGSGTSGFRTSGGSFGSGSSRPSGSFGGFSSSRPSSGSSFGGFGGGRSSSFGGGGRSSFGGFGGRRR